MVATIITYDVNDAKALANRAKHLGFQVTRQFNVVKARKGQTLPEILAADKLFKTMANDYAHNTMSDEVAAAHGWTRLSRSRHSMVGA